MASLEGKVCIVTGANSGIGQAIAILLAERKASVVLCGQNEQRLENSLNMCVNVSPGRNRNKFLTVRGDLTDTALRNSIIDKTVRKFGKIDVLVCNAGTASNLVPMTEMTESMYDSIMDVNVKSVFFLIQRAEPHLEKTKGVIIAVSSVFSKETTPYMAYSASKAAVDHMIHCCAAHFGKKGIRANTVNPTLVRQTRIFRYLFQELMTIDDEDLKNNPDALMDAKALAHPLNQRVATPEDVARAVAFLASNEASYITGQNLDIDGGVSCESAVFPSNE